MVSSKNLAQLNQEDRQEIEDECRSVSNKLVDAAKKARIDLGKFPPPFVVILAPPLSVSAAVFGRNIDFSKIAANVKMSVDKVGDEAIAFVVIFEARISFGETIEDLKKNTMERCLISLWKTAWGSGETSATRYKETDFRDPIKINLMMSQFDTVFPSKTLNPN